MVTLTKQALIGLVKFEFFLAILLFVPAWSFRFWQAWVFWSAFSLCIVGISLYFLKHDPGLVKRRLHVGPGAERRTTQKIIQAVAGALFCVLLVVPGLDYRFGWSEVPTPAVLSANVVIVLSLLIIYFVFKANSHTGATVTVEAGQQVVSTGPYRFVRHPMYAGGVIGLLATPLALGSYWALLVAVPLCIAVVVRLLDEERFLCASLPGYDAYRTKSATDSCPSSGEPRLSAFLPER